MIIFETTRFYIEVGTVGKDKDPQYLVISKDHGVIEFCNSSLFFCRDWARQMTKALDQQDEDIENPKEEEEEETNLLPFTGGNGGRAN